MWCGQVEPKIAKKTKDSVRVNARVTEGEREREREKSKDSVRVNARVTEGERERERNQRTALESMLGLQKERERERNQRTVLDSMLGLQKEREQSCNVVSITVIHTYPLFRPKCIDPKVKHQMFSDVTN